MGLLIRRATAADADTLAEFNRLMALETEHRHLNPAVLRAGVRAVFGDPAKGFYTVAEGPGGAVVGQMLTTFEWSDWRDGWFWWVQSVYVREDARRGGVFRALYAHLRAEAAADPTVIGIRLYMEQDNDRARKTYEHLGMAATPYLVFEEYPLPGRANSISEGTG